MIKIYDVNNDYIRFRAENDEENKALKNFKEYLQTVYIETVDGNEELLVRKSKK